MKSLRFCALAILVSCVALASPAAAHERQVTITTGQVTGVYFPAGGAICQLINETKADHGFQCYVEPSGGSVDNIRAVQEGRHTFGISQSDWQFHAYLGTSQFRETGPVSELRSVFSLHAEPFTLLARADAGISTFEDLLQKRVNLSNYGSGQRGTMKLVMDLYGWTAADFAEDFAMPASVQSSALCADRFDATIYMVGHPSSSVHEATIGCDAVLVNVTGPIIDRLVNQHAYYRYATIPGGMYRGIEEDVRTFGVGATLVTSSDVPNNVVYQLTKSVFENLDRLRSLHPAFAQLDAQTMISDGLSAPLHNGAARYYREVDLMQ